LVLEKNTVLMLIYGEVFSAGFLSATNVFKMG
jgi:hypothetical protein